DSEEDQLNRIAGFFSTQMKVYEPQSQFNLVFWKTKDIPASTPGEYQEVRDQVIEAWKTQQARKLAREEADRIRKVVSNTSADKALAQLRKEAEGKPEWGSLISLDEVARQIPKLTAREGPKTYEDYKVPRDKVPYPPENFVDLLLKLKEGEASVIQD